MIYDLNILEEYVEKGLLRKAEDQYLVQYNYSELCNNQGLWDEITSFNRGNIYEKSSGELIAQAMPKFMNFGQLSEEEQSRYLSHNKLWTTEKKDGCLGILYMYNGEIRCNSRGGFDNYVTDVIKRLLPKYVMLKTILKFNTLCVEVISPETKIICDYGQEEELYLLSAISKNPEIGELDEQCLDTLSQVIKMPRPKRNYMGWDSLLRWTTQADFTEEGFVVCIPSKKYNCWERVKIKSEDYLRIAKLKACLNKHTLWKMWKADIEQGTDLLKPYLNSVPDELYKTAKTYMDEIQTDMDKLRNEVNELAHDTRNIDIKHLNKFLGDIPLKGAVFNIRNGKPIDRILIKMCEPKYKGEEDGQE